MPVPRETLIVLREWVAKAEEDWMAVRLVLRGGADCPPEVACFHAQQCIEKYAKASLVLHGTAFPKTHDIRLLWNLLPQDSRPMLDQATQDRLTEFATVTRYPGEYEAVSLSEARKAASTTRLIRKALRSGLPRAALRRGGRSR
ncbi:MAG: HEPN domain-containing protein [Planctomycetota bacterium]